MLTREILQLQFLEAITKTRMMEILYYRNSFEIKENNPVKKLQKVLLIV